MIHELLIGTNPKARPVLTWNMLIGGPNQSHKVNFKEPLPARGKISKKTFAFCSVNTFPDIFRKSFGKERCFLGRLAHPVHRWTRELNEGISEHGNCFFFIKTFLDNKSNAAINLSLLALYDILLLFFIRQGSKEKSANTPNMRPANIVSIPMIQEQQTATMSAGPEASFRGHFGRISLPTSSPMITHD